LLDIDEETLNRSAGAMTRRALARLSTSFDQVQGYSAATDK
jgi:hypothetical protein